VTHTITLERGRALVHALKRADSPAEREAFAVLAVLRRRWQARAKTRANLAARPRVALPPWARPSEVLWVR
jgi:uncharacterized lipoprotein YbaY